MFAFYFPATVKILYGKRLVEAAAYITAWLYFGFIPPFVDLMLSWSQPS